ncbi:MAG: AAA family ATPase [Thermogutta sp.]|nr:AAA family ATPase [Thermogutta sp.]HPU06495.1 AAA family ATPase [Thermogutta sp.]
MTREISAVANPVVTRCLEYWGIRSQPFSPQRSAETFFLSSGAEEVLVRLDYVVREGYAGAVLVGSSGVGKTLLLRRALQTWRRHRRAVVFVNATGQDRLSLTTALAYELGASRSEGPAAILWQELRDHVVARLWSYEACVIICDDVARGTPDVLGLLLALGQITTNGRRPTLIGSCRHDEIHYPTVHQQSWYDIHVELPPWSVEEVQQYLCDRLREAGTDPAEVFTLSAMERLAELTGGNPRDVNRLAEWCLLVAAGAEVRPIGPELVTDVFEELYSQVGDLVLPRSSAVK